MASVIAPNVIAAEVGVTSYGAAVGTRSGPSKKQRKTEHIETIRNWDVVHMSQMSNAVFTHSRQGTIICAEYQTGACAAHIMSHTPYVIRHAPYAIRHTPYVIRHTECMLVRTLQRISHKL